MSSVCGVFDAKLRYRCLHRPQKVRYHFGFVVHHYLFIFLCGRDFGGGSMLDCK